MNASGRPWKRAALWLALLGPLFFSSYGWANHFTAARGTAGELVFGWEHALPFVPGLILPYMSIDLFYAVSLFVCTTRAELDRHAHRLLLANALALAGFLLFPLRFTFTKPAVAGFNGALFGALGGFDLPYNQAPSLHIIYLVILWSLYARHARGAWRFALHGWFALIGVSVLLVWQHHAIDLWSGALAGLFCLRALPERRPDQFPSRRSIPLAALYALGALILGLGGAALGGWGWLLLWPAVALAAVATAYAGAGAALFGKSAGGALTPSSRWLLAPYRLGEWLNARIRTRGHNDYDEIEPGVRLGRLPSRRELAEDPPAAVLDLTAEFAGRAPAGADYLALPVLDLTPPDPALLREAAAFIEHSRSRGPVQVHCALGAGRSSAAVAAWLVATGRAPDARAAFARLDETRPVVVFSPAVLAAVDAAARGAA